jgi:hypothetical protein
MINVITVHWQTSKRVDVRKRFEGRPAVETLLFDGHGLRGVADSSLDAAFSYGVFVHLQPWDIYNYLVELRRTRKPAGKAIIQRANTLGRWDGSPSSRRCHRW